MTGICQINSYVCKSKYTLTLGQTLVIQEYICSAQSENRYNSVYCPAQSENSHFVGRSRNSYFALCNSGIARARSGNRNKVRIRVIASRLLIILNGG